MELLIIQRPEWIINESLNIFVSSLKLGWTIKQIAYNETGFYPCRDLVLYIEHLNPEDITDEASNFLLQALDTTFNHRGFIYLLFTNNIGASEVQNHLLQVKRNLNTNASGRHWVYTSAITNLDCLRRIAEKAEAFLVK